MGPKNLSLLIAVCIANAWLARPAIAQNPLVKNGPCPELVRKSAPWLNTAEVRSRFITNNSYASTLKANPGTIQDTLSPQQSINCSQVPAGFRAELWASERDATRINSLQSFTFDERGRMWAVETFDYPNEIESPFAGRDRVVILEDTDGDRRADKLTVFVSGLNIPQGIEIVPQGVVVAMAPHLVLFEDKNGDDKADSPQGRILYTGFRKGDTHGQVQGTMIFGMDNWLYGGTGYNGGSVGGTGFSAGLWRVRIDTTRFEFIGRANGGGGNNMSGVGMMEDGQLFNSTATEGGTAHSQHNVIPGVMNNEIGAYGNDVIEPTKDIVAGDHPGGFSSGAGHDLYTARLFPPAFWNRAAFVNEPTSHIVNVDFLKPDKSTWTATRNSALPNLFASTDAWVAPLVSKVGPDGGVWVLDWYTYVILHNGMSCCQGGGHAWESPLRTRSQERIYRIVPDDGKLDPVLNLANAGFPELVGTFANTNMFWRLMAQKLILRKATTPAAKAEVEPLLEAAVKSRRRDEVGLDPIALHAMWAAQNLGLFATNAAKWDPLLKGLLVHPSPAVRMNVVKAMPATAASMQSIKDQCIVNDEDPHVRLQVLIQLKRMPALGGIAMWSTFQNLDSWSQQAFTGAGAGKVTSSASRPCTPAVGVAQPSGPPSAAGRRLRFALDRDGWRVLPDASLEAGELGIYDVRGGMLDRITYDGRNWSRRLRLGSASHCHYVFRTRGGTVLQGRFALQMTR